MKTLTRLLLATAATLLTACYPESKNPIAPSTMNINDPTLEGTWCVRNKTETVFYHIHHSDKNTPGQMNIISVEVPKNGNKMTQEPLQITTARIAATTYLSFRNTGPKAEKTYGFIRYKLDWRGRLNLYMADDNTFADAILTGKLRGTAKKNQFSTTVTLTDTSERIAAYLASPNGQTAFNTDPLILEKVK